MEWLVRLNEALDYLEQNLAGEIEMKQAAKLACCSVYHFQRMFAYIAGTPLSEYIRRRRMTAAAFDLQNGEKVLDVALRYGYESPTSFNRAFQSVHGVPPSAAQKEGARLKAYPRISFQITIKGDTEMDYRMEKKEAFRIVGARIDLEGDWEKSFAKVPQFWAESARKGLLPQLCGMMNREPMGILGVSTNIHGEDVHYYIAASTDAEAPEGMVEYQVPACTWAIFPGVGSTPQAIQELQKRIVSEWLPASGYEYADAPDIEVYPDPQMTRFEVWLPVVKKENP